MPHLKNDLSSFFVHSPSSYTLTPTVGILATHTDIPLNRVFYPHLSCHWKRWQNMRPIREIYLAARAFCRLGEEFWGLFQVEGESRTGIHIQIHVGIILFGRQYFLLARVDFAGYSLLRCPEGVLQLANQDTWMLNSDSQAYSLGYSRSFGHVTCYSLVI